MDMDMEMDPSQFNSIHHPDPTHHRRWQAVGRYFFEKKDDEERTPYRTHR
jgi:hypothetical protein